MKNVLQLVVNVHQSKKVRFVEGEIKLQNFETCNVSNSIHTNNFFDNLLGQTKSLITFQVKSSFSFFKIFPKFFEVTLTQDSSRLHQKVEIKELNICINAMSSGLVGNQFTRNSTTFLTR